MQTSVEEDLPADPSQPYQFLPPLEEAAYQELKADIRRRGIQVPIETDEYGACLDGHHRLRAAGELGISSYPRLIRSGLSESEKREHALSLNLHRRHLTRPQRQSLVVMLHGTGWSSRRIAAAVGVSAPTVLRDLAGATGVSGVTDVTPDTNSLEESRSAAAIVVGMDGKTYPARRRPTTVLVRTDREQRVALEALQKLGDSAPASHTDLRRLERLRRDQRSQEARQDARDAIQPLPDGVEIQHCSIDALDLPALSVDMIITDPPYTRKAMEEGTYARLASFAMRSLRPGGFLCAYAPTMFLPTAISDLGESGLKYWWTYAITFPRYPLQIRQRALASGYRPVLVYRKHGDDRMPNFTIDVIVGGGRSKETDHPWQQADGEVDTLIEAFTEPRDLLVDPFCGTGTIGLSAHRLGRRFIGADIDEASTAIARSRLLG